MCRVVMRGDIVYADLGKGVGSEQGGVRPVVILQNDLGNKFSPTVICASITSKIHKSELPTHVELSKEDYKLTSDSLVLLEQIRTIDKHRLQNKIDAVRSEDMNRIDQALLASLGLGTLLQTLG